MPLTEKVVAKLAKALELLQINEGIAQFERIAGDLEQIGPATPNAGSLLLLVAQWIDAGCRDARFLQPILDRFGKAQRGEMTVNDYLQLRMTEGFYALSGGKCDEAIGILDFVVQAHEDFGDASKLALAHFWKARAHRKKGEYENALAHIVLARNLADASGAVMLRAVARIHESWLLFQKGLKREALRLLATSEAALRSTDHYVALGNIESARGRIVRRAGDYASALKHFANAERLYEKRNPQHPNLARCLVNSSYVRRIIALQIRKDIDRSAQPGRSRPTREPRGNGRKAEPLRTRYLQLCQEACQSLHRACEIYELNGNQNGVGDVVLNLGCLHLDRGEIDPALQRADAAFRIGSERNDPFLKTRARILAAWCENAHIEEQTGEHDDLTAHANRALEYSEEALELARGMQNRRLIAAAYLARGMTAANDLFQDWELARTCASEAATHLGPWDNDLLVEILADLKSCIVRAAGINDILRAWSEGMLGNKTFQQITEEFAEIVIPNVWIREDRKIARVAQRLSISPKKVRRILRNAGWC